MPTSHSRARFRFGEFELDVGAYELRRLGRSVKLGRQPMDLLILLVESPGQLVSRSIIVDRLWGSDVFVDVETGVNTNISKVRQALRDSPEAPRFVETVPGKGYRFVAPVEVVAIVAAAGAAASATEAATPMAPAAAPQPTRALGRADSTLLDAAESSGASGTPAASESSDRDSPALRNRFAAPARVLAVLVVLAATAGLFVWTGRNTTAPASRVTLAVLPFQNLGDGPERQYLADGFTDETSASLAQIDPERLIVKGRTLRYRGTTKTAVEIGRELGVDYLVESSIRAEGSRVRITATLIRVRDQEHVWSHTYEREPTTLLGLQQELSSAIADQVRLRLSPAGMAGLERRQTRSADAYDEYLRARFLAARRTSATNQRALEHLRRAVAIDPDYALAWSELAFIYTAGVVNGDAPPQLIWPLARQAAAEALRANRNLAETHMAAGYKDWLLEWNWGAAEDEYGKALSLDPGTARTHLQLGHVLSQMGRHGEAEQSTRRARDLEPLEAINHALSSQVSFQGRDYAAAVGHARQAILLDSNLWIGYMMLGQAYAQIGETELALEVIGDAARLSGGNSKALSLRGYVLANAGRTGEAREVLQTFKRLAKDRFVPPVAFALIHAGLGERDAVFEWLEQGFAVRDVHLMYLPVDAKWDAYREDPRFKSLLARCGFTGPAAPVVSSR